MPRPRSREVKSRNIFVRISAATQKDSTACLDEPRNVLHLPLEMADMARDAGGR
jgi:hypothetical protein